jgi:hypothetical protein
MIQQSVSPIERLSLADLDTRCRQETRHYRKGEISDSRFCLEIFRRALAYVPAPDTNGQLVAAGEDARTLLVQIYTDYIKANINRAALPSMSLDDLIQTVWLRFWRAANRGLVFPTLDAALNYIKLTTTSALIEERRRERHQQQQESLQMLIEAIGEEPLADAAADPFDQHAQQRFRTRCREVLTEPLTYRIFWMRYSMGQPPRQIAKDLLREGVLLKGREPTARLVSDLLEWSCEQLSHDHEIRDLLGSD